MKEIIVKVKATLNQFTIKKLMNFIKETPMMEKIQHIKEFLIKEKIRSLKQFQIKEKLQQNIKRFQIKEKIKGIKQLPIKEKLQQFIKQLQIKEKIKSINIPQLKERIQSIKRLQIKEKIQHIKLSLPKAKLKDKTKSMKDSAIKMGLQIKDQFLTKERLKRIKKFHLDKKNVYKAHVKESLSILLATFGIIFLWPLMILIGAAIKVSDGGSIFFCQERLGKDLKVFKIYKFRTMVYNSTPDKILDIRSEEDDRITKIGRILRKTSLDELPQLFNILKGEMCIIGPRPIMKDEFELYKNSSIAKTRFIVKPGLFCTVDIEYRAVATRDKQFEMDAEYVNNITFLKDLTIFIRVLKTVLSRKNVYSIPLKEEQNMYHTPSTDEKGDLNS